MTLNLDFDYSRSVQCNFPEFTALKRFFPCSFKSEVTDCIMRKTAKRSQL